ncbi:hypothetical protein H257_16391 [Aphanomyces astaci]|uniref:Uncharacterized protein n=1 Tax=Aphanomyces astaci TaxID=112090 RepID=W4FKL6_APHAT|nr:hypothetical protein H257_16391 [Aphanomyces astaci]ETV67416.1 hypothetical protein H257_16391 [Aphanomyces astaci]|eukprot:XP_009843107.1 hypothetical protein H257_16391 [Aphanomyces astaci]
MSRNEFVMWEAAKPILGRHSSTSTTNARRFVALFGTTLYVTSVLWAKLEPHPRGGQPRHLLWALMFLKVYGTEHVHATIAAVDEKTYRKWSWMYIKAFEDLTEVVFNNRFDEAPMGTNLFVSLDGTDCPVQEPFPFDPSWWSHKLNRAGIRYEVALARDVYVLAVNEVKKRNLTNSEREAILREVLLHSNSSYLVTLPNNLSQTLAAKYN